MNGGPRNQVFSGHIPPFLTLPLHANAMELAARRRVRKRDVSVGPQSRKGVRAWDTFRASGDGRQTRRGANWPHRVPCQLIQRFWKGYILVAHR